MRISLHPCIYWLLFLVADEDRCKNGFAACGLHATCKITPGFYECICFSGFTRVKEACQDIDECKKKFCHTDAYCENTPGNFSCYCKDGYEGDGYKKCVDTDECKIVNYKVLCTRCILRNHWFVMWWAVQQPHRTPHAFKENSKITATPLALIYSFTLKCFWAGPGSSKTDYANPR